VGFKVFKRLNVVCDEDYKVFVEIIIDTKENK
jgi:hypothetical protein